MLSGHRGWLGSEGGAQGRRGGMPSGKGLCTPAALQHRLYVNTKTWVETRAESPGSKTWHRSCPVMLVLNPDEPLSAATVLLHLTEHLVQVKTGSRCMLPTVACQSAVPGSTLLHAAKAQSQHPITDKSQPASQHRGVSKSTRHMNKHTKPQSVQLWDQTQTRWLPQLCEAHLSRQLHAHRRCTACCTRSWPELEVCLPATSPDTPPLHPQQNRITKCKL